MVVAIFFSFSWRSARAELVNCIIGIQEHMRCVVHTKSDSPEDQVIVSQYYQWVTFVFAIQVRTQKSSY